MASGNNPSGSARTDDRWKPERPDNVPAAMEFSMLQVRDRVVIKLLYEELVKEEDIERAWTGWRKLSASGQHVPLWRVMASDKSLDTDVIFAEAAKAYSFPFVQVDDRELAVFLSKVKNRLKTEQWQRLAKLDVAPIRIITENPNDAGRLVLATHDPGRPDLFRKLKESGFKNFEVWYAPTRMIRDVLQIHGPGDAHLFEEHEDLAFDLGTMDEQSTIDADLDAEINRSALIALFERVLSEAVRQGASDIHIFPNAQRQTEIHFRINGELSVWRIEDRVHPEAILAVIKDNAQNVDRFERENSQDGFIQRTVDDAVIRFRVSVIPLANQRMDIRSESIVIRVLDDRKVIRDLGKLGLGKVALERFNWAIRQPFGMVILTGPTGSGKTTTLFASLCQIISPKINVLTVEDPVEYIIPEVRQVKLTHKFGLESALRAILRHDPDVVMVGEMRDQVTAELAIKLSNTGHLTFSTLHTNDAPSSVSRLMKMGIEPFLIAYAINLVVAQRLIRILCDHCKKVEEPLDEVKLRHLGFSEEQINNVTFYTASEDGECSHCRNSGYSGRSAITETMPFSPAIRELIVSSDGSVNEAALRQTATEEGMTSLADRAREIVLEGSASTTEMIRVVFTGM